MKCSELPSRLAIDSSVVLTYLLGESLADLVEECILFSDREVYLPSTALAEIYYVTCRLRGREVAQRLNRALKDSETVEIVHGLDEVAGELKYDRAISLADCYVIALARTMDAAAVFAKREKELVREMERVPFDVNLLFLEDLGEDMLTH
ncbi:MAG: PIN domain-containing protein [Candidatus Korarchaeota archaeon]|nr:PIN domain-containing protein [Candidatus Korarchaeota archaeon]